MILPLVAVFTFIMGFNAYQKGEVAWSRTKTITGQSAKIIGICIILVSLAMGGVSLYATVLYQMMNDDYRVNHAATSTGP